MAPTTVSAEECMDLVRTVGAMRRGFAQRLSPILQDRYGVDMQLFVLLKRIEQGAAHPGALARGAMEPPSQITRQIDKLQALGFVVRTLDREDSRRIRLQLTEKARALLGSVDDAVVSLIGPPLAELPAADRKALIEGLRHINAWLLA